MFPRKSTKLGFQAYGEFLARKSALEPTDIQVAGKPVSLYPLYKTVLSNGGSTKVSEGRKWKTVAAALELNTSGSALALLKKVHTTHLVEFEAEQIASGAVSPMKIEPRTASDSVPPTPTQGALTPQQSSTAMKPLYLPFKRELAAELGGYDPTLLNGDHTLGAKRIQKEEFGKYRKVPYQSCGLLSIVLQLR